MAITTDTRLADDWNTAPAMAAHTRTRAMPRPTCQGRRWVVPADSRSPRRWSRWRAKADRVGAGDWRGHGSSRSQLLTDSIWATRNEEVPTVVRLGKEPADPVGPAQRTVHVTVAVIGKAASFGLPFGVGWPAEVSV